VANAPFDIKPKGSRYWRLELSEEAIFALDDLLDKFLNEYHDPILNGFMGWIWIISTGVIKK